MRIYISGGCKNGKSFFAQRLAKAQAATMAPKLYYVATMQPADREDELRIARHRDERAGWGFQTVERPRDIEKILETCDRGASFLLDSVTALLANEMFPGGDSFFDGAGEKTAAGLAAVLGRVENIVLVSDYIFGDAALYDPITEKYRESLAAVDRAAARLCDAVIEVVCAIPVVHKKSEAFDALLRSIS